MYKLWHTWMHTIQENLYYVFENSRAWDSCSSEIIFSDPDAPELPPPLEQDSQDTDTAPPVCLDINELSCKPNKVIDCDEGEQQCQHGEPWRPCYWCMQTICVSPTPNTLNVSILLDFQDYLYRSKLSQ